VNSVWSLNEFPK